MTTMTAPAEITPTAPPMMTVIIGSGRARARVRIVDGLALGAVAAESAAIKPDGTSCHARHGGGVANKYGYPAYTDAGVAVAIRELGQVVWMTSLPANKVTLAGAARVAGASALWDGRCGEARTAAARRDLVARARRILGWLRRPEGGVVRLTQEPRITDPVAILVADVGAMVGGAR